MNLAVLRPGRASPAQRGEIAALRAEMGPGRDALENGMAVSQGALRSEMRVRLTQHP